MQLGNGKAEPASAAPERSLVGHGEHELEGRVLDATGGPVARARVTAQRAGDTAPMVSGSSDEMGRYVLTTPAGEFILEATADGYSPGRRRAQSPARGLKLLLAPASSIRGRVIERASGRALKALQVTATNQAAISAVPITVLSESNGEFDMPALAPGAYDLQAVGAGFRAGPLWVTLGVAQAIDSIELVADPASMLTATIQVEGEPCDVGRVELSGPISSVVPTEKNGGLRVDGLLPGRYSLIARCDDALSAYEELEVDTLPLDRVFDLERGLSLTGSVRDRFGTPLRGVVVRVQPIIDPAKVSRSEAATVLGRECVTDVHGDFACKALAPGAHDCEAALGDRAISDRQRVSLREGVRTNVVLTVGVTASIRASIRNASAASGQHPVFARRGLHAPIEAVRQGDEFVFEALELGSYHVYVGFASDASTGGRRVELSRGDQVVTISLDAPEELSISGRVLDDRGQPELDAWVHASPIGSTSGIVQGPVLTDERGAFSIPALSAGTYEVTAVSPRGEATAHGVSGGEGNVVIELPSYGSFSGIVKTSEGDPVTDFSLEYGVDSGPSTTISSTSQGTWSVPWVAPGSYRLSITSRSETVTEEVTLMPGAHLHVPIVLAGRASP